MENIENVLSLRNDQRPGKNISSCNSGVYLEHRRGMVKAVLAGPKLPSADPAQQIEGKLAAHNSRVFQLPCYPE